MLSTADNSTIGLTRKFSYAWLTWGRPHWFSEKLVNTDEIRGWDPVFRDDEAGVHYRWQFGLRISVDYNTLTHARWDMTVIILQHSCGVLPIKFFLFTYQTKDQNKATCRVSIENRRPKNRLSIEWFDDVWPNACNISPCSREVPPDRRQPLHFVGISTPNRGGVRDRAWYRCTARAQFKHVSFSMFVTAPKNRWDDVIRWSND